jgi:5'-phosphate synthase pdxT subunit
LKVGVLAVQGDFEAHAASLARLGVECVFVRTPKDLEGVSGLILPGGESTTQWKFLVGEGLDSSIREHAASGGAIFGTCAGAILLASEVKHPEQASLALFDMTVIRNGYGRQVASEVRIEPTMLSPEPVEMVFIRAPVIERIGPGVETLAIANGTPVMVREGNILIATFHPELTLDIRVHSYFLQMVNDASRSNAKSKTANPIAEQQPTSLVAPANGN